jgi:hypothetical protein
MSRQSIINSIPVAPIFDGADIFSIWKRSGADVMLGANGKMAGDISWVGPTRCVPVEVGKALVRAKQSRIGLGEGSNCTAHAIICAAYVMEFYLRYGLGRPAFGWCRRESSVNHPPHSPHFQCWGIDEEETLWTYDAKWSTFELSGRTSMWLYRIGEGDVFAHIES